MPNIYIIAGCNGAGKTTASLTILPEIFNCKEFVNADSIALGLSPFNAEGAAFESGRIMLNRIRQLINEQKDFAFETTLSTKSYISLIKSAKEKGYKKLLVYFWLNTYELAKERVAKRVKLGGHNIPEEVIERRYFRGVNNLFNHFITLCHEWFIYNNSDKKISLIADYCDEESLKIYDPVSYQQIKEQCKKK